MYEYIERKKVRYVHQGIDGGYIRKSNEVKC